MTIFIIISTHDLARRSTKNPNEQPQNQRNFNSRPRKEVDIEWRKGTGNTDISTHDLARRSTAWEFILCKRIGISTHDLARRSTCPSLRPRSSSILFQLTTSQGGRQQFLRKKFSFQNHFLCSLHIIYSYYINIVFFSTLFLAKSSFFLVRIP